MVRTAEAVEAVAGRSRSSRSRYRGRVEVEVEVVSSAAAAENSCKSRGRHTFLCMNGYTGLDNFLMMMRVRI